MNRSQQPALTLFAVGMIGLGILALIYGDFALVWQPVAPWVPGRTLLAYLRASSCCSVVLDCFFSATAAWSVRILFPYLIVWVLLKVPALFVAPQMEAVWLGFGEMAVLLAGGWVLFARLADCDRDRRCHSHGRKWRSPGTDSLRSFSVTDRAFTSCLCEGNG